MSESKVWNPKERDLRWFEHGHLPEDLRAVAAPISALADDLYEILGSGAEKSAGLRKLLEAKDCFVRQAVDDRPETLHR